MYFSLHFLTKFIKTQTNMKTNSFNQLILKQSLSRVAFWAVLLFLWPVVLQAQDSDEEKDPLSESTFSGLTFRCIGPAYTGGRIADFAMHPDNPFEYYVAVAAGNVWKTTNAGNTWQPIFDSYGAWSIADVEIDPNNPHVVWVGTGEYNSQRAIGYGDGVYRSDDGGKSFKNMGLKESEHIGRIAIDPRNSDVYVAAQGPLWGPGGDRGLYKTTDDGETWDKILDISENTGVTDIVFDPRNPDVLYCATYQRRRRVFTLVNGGPEAAIYKSSDAGKTWNKLSSGLPSADMGRIGLAISPANPDYIYAIIEAAGDAEGIYRSTNRGATWEKRSSYMSTSGQYYNRLYCDPHNPEKVFSMDTYSKYTVDGGKTWENVGNNHKHVDDHAMWIDPNDTDHLILGSDGGIYETWDHGTNWDFKGNMPITQFYRVAVDNARPFYNVYGGTQDNNSLGGPSRTIRRTGIHNEDWIITNGGDGFQSRIDPENPDIVYAQAQYGWIVRYDKQSGEAISIKPQPPAGEAYRWNWNAPLVISPHSNTRLYFGANKLFRSNDRGNTWEVISPDLTRQIDRNTLPVMGKIQSVDAVAKNASTSLFGSIVEITESPLQEDLIYIGTDDGLIQVTEDAGENWTKYTKFGNVPEMTYVSSLLASRHDANTVYACFDGRKNNDLKPYILKSTNKGKSWTSLTNNLPDRGTVYTIVEDPVNPDLLFIGTEFALYFTIDGGQKWVKLGGGLPVTQIRDLAIQERETDLVAATFGRSFYILDNYAPLRTVTPELLNQESHLFAVKDALMYIEERGKGNLGTAKYGAENPPIAAIFTFYLKDKILTLKEQRQKAEKEAEEAGKTVPYPSWDELYAEDNEEAPYLLFTVHDEDNNVVRRIKAPAKAGIQRVEWDLRYPSTFPLDNPRSTFADEPSGMFVAPGTYSVSVAKVVRGEKTDLNQTQEFNVVPLNNTTLPAADRDKVVAFQTQVAELGRSVYGAASIAEELKKRIQVIEDALFQTPDATEEMFAKARKIEQTLDEILLKLNGNESISSRNANQVPYITDRMGSLMWGFYRSTGMPTQTFLDQMEIIQNEFEPLYNQLIDLRDKDIKQLEEQMELIEAPYTPGRMPEWDR